MNHPTDPTKEIKIIGKIRLQGSYAGPSGEVAIESIIRIPPATDLKQHIKDKLLEGNVDDWDTTCLCEALVLQTNKQLAEDEERKRVIDSWRVCRNKKIRSSNKQFNAT